MAAWVEAHEVVESFKAGPTSHHEDEETLSPVAGVTSRHEAGATLLHEGAVISPLGDEAVLEASSCPEAAVSREVEVVQTLHPEAVAISHPEAGETLRPEAVATSHLVAGEILHPGDAETSHLVEGVTSRLEEGATSPLEAGATSMLLMAVAMLVGHPATKWAVDRPCGVGLPCGATGLDHEACLLVAGAWVLGDRPPSGAAGRDRMPPLPTRTPITTMGPAKTMATVVATMRAMERRR